MNRMHLMSLATVAAFAVLPGVSMADADGGDQLTPAAYPVTEFPVDNGVYDQAACRKAEWFKRQMELTDGDVSPFVAPTECRIEKEVLASTQG